MARGYREPIACIAACLLDHEPVGSQADRAPDAAPAHHIVYYAESKSLTADPAVRSHLHHIHGAIPTEFPVVRTSTCACMYRPCVARVVEVPRYRPWTVVGRIGGHNLRCYTACTTSVACIHASSPDSPPGPRSL
jgi:hypothetical protein